MQIKNIALTAAIVAALAFAGCAKKEEAPAVEAPAAEAAAPAPEAAPAPAADAAAPAAAPEAAPAPAADAAAPAPAADLLLLQHHKLHLSNLLLSEKGELLLSFFIAYFNLG
jgi:hypothetical protein